MFVELIESLRCPRPHEEAPLIASASRTESRYILEGTLGCPVCAAEFAISSGVARFGEPDVATAREEPSAETAMRIAAFLELADTRGFALLCGRWGAHADHIRRLSDTPLVLVNPPSDVAAEVAGVIATRDAVPFAASAARAAALDDAMSAALVASTVRTIRVGGRVMGPASLGVPAGVTELVRDEHVWVGEKTTASSPPRLVPLTRASR